MPGSIARETVEHIARLARLKMGPDEIERYRRDLAAILAYIEQLNELDTEAVAPTAHPLAAHTVLRDDELRESYDPDRALGNAPGREGSFFTVPKVLDQDR